MKKSIESLEDKIESLKDKMGDIYELSTRFKISKTQGDHYTSKFDAFDLNGLVRIALPRKPFPSEKVIYDSQAYVLSSRVNKLANYIYVSRYKILWIFYRLYLM